LIAAIGRNIANANYANCFVPGQFSPLDFAVLAKEFIDEVEQGVYYDAEVTSSWDMFSRYFFYQKVFGSMETIRFLSYDIPNDEVATQRLLLARKISNDFLHYMVRGFSRTLFSLTNS
jgi:hypothetical protein